jgi:hypothetical protein
MTTTELDLEKARQRAYNLQAEAEQMQAEYEQRIAAIQNNAELSQIGRNNAIKKLLAEQRQRIDGLVIRLRRAAIEEAVEADVSQGVRDLVKREYSNWDYGRLTYEANRVRSAFVLAGGDDFDKIAEAWQQAKARGDKYEIKAWMDTAPALLPQAQAIDSHGTQTRQSIIEDIAASEIFTLTEEGKKFEAERAGRVKNLEILAGASAQVSQSLQSLGSFGRGSDGETYVPGSTLQGNQVIARVFDGIALDRKSGELHVERKPGEKAAQMYERTEAAYQESVKQIEAIAGENFDALVYGTPGHAAPAQE